MNPELLKLRAKIQAARDKGIPEATLNKAVSAATGGRIESAAALDSLAVAQQGAAQDATNIVPTSPAPDNTSEKQAALLRTAERGNSPITDAAVLALQTPTLGFGDEIRARLGAAFGKNTGSLLNRIKDLNPVHATPEVARREAGARQRMKDLALLNPGASQVSRLAGLGPLALLGGAVLGPATAGPELPTLSRIGLTTLRGAGTGAAAGGAFAAGSAAGEADGTLGERAKAAAGAVLPGAAGGALLGGAAGLLRGTGALLGSGEGAGPRLAKNLEKRSGQEEGAFNAERVRTRQTMKRAGKVLREAGPERTPGPAVDLLLHTKNPALDDVLQTMAEQGDADALALQGARALIAEGNAPGSVPVPRPEFFDDVRKGLDRRVSGGGVVQAGASRFGRGAAMESSAARSSTANLSRTLDEVLRASVPETGLIQNLSASAGKKAGDLFKQVGTLVNRGGTGDAPAIEALLRGDEVVQGVKRPLQLTTPRQIEVARAGVFERFARDLRGGKRVENFLNDIHNKGSRYRILKAAFGPNEKEFQQFVKAVGKERSLRTSRNIAGALLKYGSFLLAGSSLAGHGIIQGLEGVSGS